jgi:lysozyme family protein
MADMKAAIAKTLVNEGGFQNYHNDRANWTGGQIGVGELVGTKYGITCQDMPGVDIKNLTEDQAIAYYAEHYWKTLYAQINSQALAEKLFDLGVLFGVGTATKILQKAAGVTPADGAFGPMTLAAINAADPTDLWTKFTDLMLQRDELILAGHPEDAEFEKDWDRRVKQP